MTDGYTALIRITDFAVDLADVPEAQAVHDELTSVLQDLLGISRVLLFDTSGHLLSLATLDAVPVPQLELLGRLVTTAAAGTDGDRVVTETDLSGDPTTGEAFGRELAQHGIRSLAVVALHVHGDRTGLLCLCSTEPHDWSDLEIACAQCLSAITSAFDAATTRLGRQATLAAQLQHALDARIVVEQAKGALAATGDISVAEAYDQMRRVARRRGVSVRAVAEAVVDKGLRLESLE